jgi:hypothetical protein
MRTSPYDYLYLLWAQGDALVLLEDLDPNSSVYAHPRSKTALLAPIIALYDVEAVRLGTVVMSPARRHEACCPVVGDEVGGA